MIDTFDDRADAKELVSMKRARRRRHAFFAAPMIVMVGAMPAEAMAEALGVNLGATIEFCGCLAGWFERAFYCI